MKIWLTGLGILAASWSMSVRAQEPAIAKPVTAWEADFADRDCGLKRHFQLGDGIVSLDIRRQVPHRGFRVIVFADKIARDGRKATTSFADLDVLEHEYVLDLESGGWEGLTFSLPPEYFDKRADADNASNKLTIRQAFVSDFSLDLQNLGSALKVMDQCLNDLLSSWGVDPAMHGSLSRHVASKDKDMDWTAAPLKLILKQEKRRGTIELDVFLRVGADGRASSCEIWDDVATTRAGKKACKMMLRLARFIPALDKDGNPIESFFLLDWRAKFWRTISIL